MKYKTVKWSSFNRIYDSLSVPPKGTILEIGVAGGGGLERLSNTYPDHTVVGIDADPSCKNAPYTVRIGSQASPRFLSSVIKEFAPFSLIIDDGGHRPHQHLISFFKLWPHLLPYGNYIIEDIHTCRSARWSLIPGGAMWILLPMLFNKVPITLEPNIMCIRKEKCSYVYETINGEIDCRYAKAKEK